MSEALYVAMNGARESTLAQAVNAQNLANVKTTGFRADIYRATEVALEGDQYATQVYPVSEHGNIDFSPGAIYTTGHDLDVAIEGKGWIAIQAPDGQESYTRAGDFVLDGNGQLRTGAGHLVLGNGGPISIPPSESIHIGQDGTITVRPLGQEANALATLDRIKLVDPPEKDLIKNINGLIQLKGGGNAPADANVTLVSGALESSNVNGMSAMVNMISLARQFELQVKIIQQEDQTGDQLVQLLQS